MTFENSINGFRITPEARSTLHGNSDFINKIEANNLILVWHLISLENESRCR